MIAAVALLLALAAAPAQDPGAAGTVRGQVRSEATGAPLPAAAVELRGAEVTRGIVADAEGRFTLRGVPPGRRLIRASHVGYEPLEVEVLVPTGGELKVDLSLRLRPVAISGITVRGRLDAPGRDTAAVAAPALGIAGIRLLEAPPGIMEMGLGDGPRGSPGQAPVDPTDVLFVRGVTSDLKLVLLDGAPVYTPFHVGGLVDSFDAQLLREATLYLGGAPARYDGGLSYILDLSTRSGRGDRFHSSGAVDMMSARLSAEGGVGERVRFLAGGRGVHGGGIDPFVHGSVPYGYGEGLGRLDVALGGERTLSVTGFRNREAVSLDSLGVGREAGWGNTAVSARLRGPIAGAEAEITAAVGAFRAGLPMLNDSSFPARGRTDRVRLAADFSSDAGPVRFRYGASFDHLRLFQGVRSRPADAQSRSWEGEVEGSAAGSYAEAAWHPSPRLRLRGGLRGDLFLVDTGLRLAPRLSATWMLGERVGLTAAAGRYHQYVRTHPTGVQLRPNDAPDTIFLPSGLAVDRATHFNLALHQELDDAFRLGVEGFFKTFEGAHLRGEDRTHASGVDLWVRRDAGRFRGFAGYSLTWVWSLTPTQTAADEFAGRQLVNAGVTGPLGRLAEVELRFAYGAGLPFSAIPMSPEMDAATPAHPGPGPRSLSGAVQNAADAPLLPQVPTDPYLRLDVALSRSFTTRWRSTPVEWSPYLRVLNSLDRRDALFYWSDPNGAAAPRAVASLPLLPIAGISWRF